MLYVGSETDRHGMGRHLKKYDTDIVSLRRCLLDTYGRNGDTYQHGNTYLLNCVGFRVTCGRHARHPQIIPDSMRFSYLKFPN